MAVFPSPNEVMSILVQVQPVLTSNLLFCGFVLACLLLTLPFCRTQRVLEQRITALLDKLLVKPSLVNLPSMEEGGLLLVSRTNKPTVLTVYFFPR